MELYFVLIFVDNFASRCSSIINKMQRRRSRHLGSIKFNSLVYTYIYFLVHTIERHIYWVVIDSISTIPFPLDFSRISENVLALKYDLHIINRITLSNDSISPYIAVCVIPRRNKIYKRHSCGRIRNMRSRNTASRAASSRAMIF